MFPMISDVEQVISAKSLIEEIKRELKKEGISYDRAGNIIDEDCGSNVIDEKGIPYVAAEYLRVIGGKSNIVNIDACITVGTQGELVAEKMKELM